MKVVTVGTSAITKRNIEEMRLAGIEVFACVSRDVEKAKKFADENDVPRYSNNYEKVLLANEYDFVYLGIPNSLHYSYAKKALEHGKNVIVEKPFCLNQKQARDLLSIALSRKLYIFENMKTYHTKAYKALLKDIDSIKPIKSVTLNYTKYSSRYDLFKANLPQTIISNEYGSGALMDLNCYNISFALGLFGLPKTAAYYCNKQNDIDTSGIAVLTYDNFLVNCIAGKDSNANCFADICGEKGHIYSNEDVSEFGSYTIFYNSGLNKEVNLKDDHQFVLMFNDFKNIYSNNNFYNYDYYMKLTLMEMKVLDDLRKSADIRFVSE